MDQQPPDWPDKAMFSAMILTLAGSLGILFSLLRLTDATIGGEDAVLGFLKSWPVGLMFPATIVTTVLGALAVKHQSSVFVYIGAAAGILSMAMLGVVPLLCLVSIGFMIRAHIEGEDTTLATPVPDADDWPDKAMAASMLLFVTGSITLFQAGMTYAGRFDPIFFDDASWIWGTWAALAAIFALVAAREVYNLRRAWLGTAAAITGFLAFGFYAIGPILCILALVMLGLADREQEFATAHA